MGLAPLRSRPVKLSPEAVKMAKPCRNPAVEEVVGDQITTLRGPAVVRGLLGGLLAKASATPPLKTYELEEVGSFVWSLIDGRRTFGSLSQQLQLRYKMNRAEADASLEAFLKMLADRGLITLLVKSK